MKKIIPVFLLVFLTVSSLYATSVSPDYQSEGLVLFFSSSYENVFDSGLRFITLDLFGISLFPSSRFITAHLGYGLYFSPDICNLNLFQYMGFTYYPFGQILSITANIGIDFGYAFLDHFLYIADLKLNIDIPVCEPHNISFGAGLRRRDCFKWFNWMGFNDNYYNSYNSYFFEISYRLIS